MKVDQAKRPKELEKEKARLKRLLADDDLDKAILKEAASGNFFYGRSLCVKLRCACVRLRPTHKDHVWSYLIVIDRTAEGRSIRMLTLIDEHT